MSTQLPGPRDLTCPRGRPFAESDRPLRGLLQFGHVLALPLAALGTGAYRLFAGPTPSVSGAVSLAEAWVIRHRLRVRLQSLRAGGMPFPLSEVVPFRYARLGVFAPTENVRSHFPSADRRVVDMLQTCDRHVVVLERAPGSLVYLTFGPADDVPSAAGVCIAGDRVVVSRVSRDLVDYVDFAAAPPSVVN